MSCKRFPALLIGTALLACLPGAAWAWPEGPVAEGYKGPGIRLFEDPDPNDPQPGIPSRTGGGTAEPGTEFPVPGGDDPPRDPGPGIGIDGGTSGGSGQLGGPGGNQPPQPSAEELARRAQADQLERDAAAAEARARADRAQAAALRNGQPQ